MISGTYACRMQQNTYSVALKSGSEVHLSSAHRRLRPTAEGKSSPGTHFSG